jgi:hypothetical protein
MMRENFVQDRGLGQVSRSVGTEVCHDQQLRYGDDLANEQLTLSTFRSRGLGTILDTILPMMWSSGYGDPPVLMIVPILRNIDWDNLDQVESLDPTHGGATSGRDGAVELDDTDK